jgi:adenylate kinase
MVSKDESELGKRVNEIINVRKELVSDKLIQRVLQYGLQHVGIDKNLVLDGAPRSRSQIDVVEDVLCGNNRTLDRVVFISLTEEESIRRVASRFSCSQCHTPFIINIHEQTGHSLKCDKCGGTLEQRADDTPDGVLKRLAVFLMETFPVIEFYRQKGNLLEIDGSKSVEEIHSDIVKGLGL